MAGDIKRRRRRRFIAAASGAGLAALVSPAGAQPSARPAADLEALYGEALELILRELKTAPAAGREGLLKLLDLLIR